ncbi:MAG: protein translocase subunit SecF [FCB group bacterium]|nr:protein translocase subunit SecF [FCB group bacterium]
MRLFKNTNYDFLGKRKIAITLSLIVIVTGLLSIAIKGGLNLSIDFTGGTIAQLKFEEPVDISELRGLLQDQDLGNVGIVAFGDENEVLIKTAASGTIVEQKLNSAFSGKKFETRRIESVGPKIGKELSTTAVRAILVALILILIYIAFRFDFYYAIGAVVALLHDILVTLGIFSLLNLEINLEIIAAFLTIVGYSLNDTIVVFDRIRENIKALSREKLENIVNTALNGTLSRTIITSFTTLIVVLILFIIGLSIIQLFAFALIIGVVVGTYSSIYIASPVMVYFENRAGRKMKKKK